MSLIILPAQTLVAGEQTIAPSSNDWDYTFDGGGEWPVAGNALGDHEEGGYIDSVGGDSAISSLITLDGDFEIEFTLADEDQGNWGVHAIDEDDERATEWAVGSDGMTNSYFYAHTDRAYNGGSYDSVTAIANGSAVIMSRVGSTITIKDDGATTKEWTSAYEGTMRFFCGADGSPFATDIDDLKITDSEKVQRDGFFNEGTSSNQGFGAGGGNAHGGILWTATRTGTVESLKVNVDNVASGPMNVHVELWSHDGTNPDAQIGSDSAAQSLNSTGDKTFTFGTEPSVNKGTKYWCILVDRDGGSGDIQLALLASADGFTQWGRDATLEDISVGGSDVQAEIVVNTTEEPTPDHDTLLLLQSDDSDTSQTFTDTSQFARVDTISNQVQHDTAQYKFGASSILFDGTGDWISYPHSDDFMFNSGDFTIDFHVRFASISGRMSIISKMTGGGVAGTQFDVHKESTHVIQSHWHGKEVQTSGTVAADTWYHIAFVRSRDQIGLAIDGTGWATSTTSLTGNNLSTPLYIGFTNDAGIDFNGWIDEFRVSKVARWEVGVDFDVPTASYPTD